MDRPGKTAAETLVRRALPLLAAPILIVASVLLVLHDVAFRGLITSQHVDVLAYWMPTHCLLGSSLAAGEIPTWNPYAVAGAPFASDPQSGWMNLPAMLLYTALRCDVAIRWYIVLLPVIGGLGLLWFLRREGLSRTSASAGATSFALGMAGSMLVLSFTFAGALAWTAVLLGATSAYLRSPSWPGRLAWLVAAAVAWGQVFASHAAHGVVLGTTALVAYATATLVGQLRRERRSSRQAAALAGLLVAGIILLNLVALLPRLAYLPRTTVGIGYQGIRELGGMIAGVAVPAAARPSPASAIGPAWPLLLSTAPGAYLGAATLVASIAGWWSRRLRPLVVAFAAYAAVSYLLALRPFVFLIHRPIRALPFADVYLHSPLRLALGIVLAIPILGALGLEAWRETGHHRRRLLMLLPGAVLWGALPLMMGAEPWRMALFGAGALAAGAVLVAATRRPGLLALVPALLLAELTVNALWGQNIPETRDLALEAKAHRPFTNLVEPDVPASLYMGEGPIVRALQTAGPARFISLGRSRLGPAGYLRFQSPADWPLLANNQAMVYGVEAAQGYNPTQLLRFWTFVRSVQPETRLAYKRALFEQPPEVALDLLQVGWIVGRADEPPMAGLAPVASDGRWTLYRRGVSVPRASVVSSWRVVGSGTEALQRVLTPGFDPSREVVLEDDPGFPAPAGGTTAGSARYEPLGTKSARFVVSTPVPAVVLVRTVADPNWRATVDGRPVPVLRADYVIQAVAVPAGSHTIVLSYDDPWIGYGAVGSGVALAALVGAGVALGRKQGTEPDGPPTHR
jgi:hypothetical protein